MTDGDRVGKTGVKRKTTGFGFDPAASPYHFAVVAGPDGSVTVVERFVDGDGAASAAADATGPTEAEKARLSAYLWARIAEPAAAEFNGRLIADGARSARWLKGETLLAPHFGKELTLLAWAVEDADPTVIPMMLANWRGLAPEERWWFYTTINATSSHVEHGKDRGWRRAIKIAFADNPVHLPPSSLLVGPMPTKERATKRTRVAAAPTPEASQGRLRLFETEEGTQ